MSSIAELKYNPFIPQLNILIDGRQPNEFSRLVQYTDEDIWRWCPEILNDISSEVRDDFSVIFTGTDEDAQFMQRACTNHPRCKGFRHRPLMLQDSLQKRMGYLNQFLKKNRIAVFQKTEIDAIFQVTSGRQHLLEDLESIEVTNLFCRVNIITTAKPQCRPGHRSLEHRFVLAESVAEGMRYLNAANDDIGFLICFGNRDYFVGFQGNILIYETTEENLIDTLFRCFLAVPLLRVFRICAGSIPQAFREDPTYKKLTAVDPMVVVQIPEEIEVGKSTRIQVSLDPPIGEVPELTFRVNDSALARCDGVSIFGLQPGKTALEVYRYGEKKPFSTCAFGVYVRKRVTKIILSDDALLLGEGDTFRLNWQYVPEDADNTDQVVWKSTDQQVASVDGKGMLQAVSAGTCRVICSVGNVSATCECCVRPYLQKIRTNLDTDSILLEPAQEYPIEVMLEPENCVDGTLEYSSSNHDIVNVVGGKLLAKNEGTATVTIRNQNRRCIVRINVTVERKKKNGFFRSLFHRE